MRTVTVRYLAPVFVTVDIDAEPLPGTGPDDAIGYPSAYYGPRWAVLAVNVMDEDARLDHAPGSVAYLAGGAVAEAYDEHAVNPDALTNEERARALDIAERTAWPAWTIGPG